MGISKKTEIKRKYDLARHHAWAGSVLLAILGAISWIVGFSTDSWYYSLIIISGIIIIPYILVSLFFTYTYRSSLTSDEEAPTLQTIDNHKDKIYAKLEKKKAKNELKHAKKLEKN